VVAGDGGGDPGGEHLVGPFDAAGTGFVVLVEDATLAALIGDLLHDLRAPSDAGDEVSPVVFRLSRVPDGSDELDRPGEIPGGDWAVSRDGVPCETVASWYLLSYLVWEITRLASERHLARDGGVVVHAAVAALDGRAVLLVGASHSGKSTTAAWLTARRGWSHLSDELAFVDVERERVRAFARPVGVRRGGPLDSLVDLPGSATELMVPVTRFGSVVSDATVAAIVFLTRHEGGPERLERVTRAEALARLVQQSPGIDRPDGGRFGELARLAVATPAYSLAVTDLDEAADALAALLDEMGEAVDASSDTPLGPVVDRADALGDASRVGGDRLAVSPGVLWVELDDEIVVFRPGDPGDPGEVHRLNASSATVWRALAGGAAQLEAVVSVVADRVGTPVDVVDADVRGVVGVLADRQLVVRGR
jgi:hypothetical protein